MTTLRASVLLLVALALGACAAATGVVPSLPSFAGRGGDPDGSLTGRVVTVEDTDEPAVFKLDPELRAALADATDAAAEDGIDVQITSGWRSKAYQRRLLHDAIATYGSRSEARRWVSTPRRSAHVTGDAVDVGPTSAAYWMAQHGAAFGLCQTYANEVWHYQLATTPGGTCPAPRADGAS